MTKLSRDKGARVEREIVNLHLTIGIHAERVPLSGSTNYQGNGEDVDIYLPDLLGPLCCQVKGIGQGNGWKGLHDALADADGLFLRRDAPPGGRTPPPVVVVPWRTWELLLKRRPPA